MATKAPVQFTYAVSSADVADSAIVDIMSWTYVNLELKVGVLRQAHVGEDSDFSPNLPVVRATYIRTAARH